MEPGRPGAYTLGHSQEGQFEIGYVGRSDTCLQSRLVTHNYLWRFNYFIFQQAADEYDAYALECEFWHSFKDQTRAASVADSRRVLCASMLRPAGRMPIKRIREGTMNVQGTYIRKLQNLHRDSIPGRWTDLTLNKAPHKPLLLLCVSDLYRLEPHRSNRVEPTVYIEETFDAYWRQLFENNSTSTFALPFFHLQFDGFWSLISTNGGDVDAPIIAKTPRALRSTVAHAVVDSELHELFKKPEWNQHLRSVIIMSNFAPEAHYRLVS